MFKSSLLATALLFAFVSSAQAASEPGAQGAASVQKNLEANKSKGKATKGLTNAEEHITAEHGKSEAAEPKKKGRKEARSEKHEKHEMHENGENQGKRKDSDRPEKPGRHGR